MPKDKKDRKNYIKAMAQGLYPNAERITLAKSDAVLIAHGQTPPPQRIHNVQAKLNILGHIGHIPNKHKVLACDNGPLVPFQKR